MLEIIYIIFSALPQHNCLTFNVDNIVNSWGLERRCEKIIIASIIFGYVFAFKLLSMGMLVSTILSLPRIFSPFLKLENSYLNFL